MNLTGFQLEQRGPYSLILNTTTVTVPIFCRLKWMRGSKPQKHHHSAPPPQSGSAIAGAFTQRHHKSSFFLKAFATWPWFTSRKNWNRLVFSEKWKQHGMQRQTETFHSHAWMWKAKIHNTYSFDSFWIVSPQRSTPNQPTWLRWQEMCICNSTNPHFLTCN